LYFTPTYTAAAAAIATGVIFIIIITTDHLNHVMDEQFIAMHIEKLSLMQLLVDDARNTSVMVPS
jgi:hypothetical protein